MSQFTRKLLATAAMLAAVGSASAAYDITINSVNHMPTPAVSEKVSINNGQSYFSIFPVTYVANSSIGSFLTYCVELSQGTNLPSTFTFEQTGDPFAFTAAQENSLSRLFQAAGFQSGVAAPGAADTTAKQVGLQLAVWDIMSDGSVDFTHGAFRVKTDNAGGVAYANSLWSAAQAINAADVTYSVTKLYSRTSQDYVYVVPEPSTYALMLAGIAGIGFIVRRRSRQA